MGRRKMGIFGFSKPNVTKMKAKKDVKGLIRVFKYKTAKKGSINLLDYMKEQPVQSDARKALVMIGEAAVEPLIQALKDEDSQVRGNAILALGEIGDRRAVEPLIQAIKDEDEYIRQKAAEVLYKLQDERAVKNLVEYFISALNNYDKSVRRRAADYLGEMGDPTAIEPLIQVLGDSDFYVRQSASKALGKMPVESAVEPLINTLGNEKVSIRVSAQELLKGIGELAVPRLLEALKEGSSDNLRRNSAKLLADSVPMGDTKAAVPPLMKALHDGDAMVRAYSARALGKLGSTANAAVSSLIKALKDKSPIMRQEAAWALGKIGGQAVIPHLIQFIEREPLAESEVTVNPRKAAIQTLCHIGEPAVPHLIKMLQDIYKIDNAVIALDLMGRALLAVPHIIQLYKDEVISDYHTSKLVSKIGKPAIPYLIDALEDKDPKLRRWAARILGDLGGDAKVTTKLKKALRDKESDVRQAAANTLKKLETKK